MGCEGSRPGCLPSGHIKDGQLKRALSIFATFLKFGCFTFGGGWSIVAQMQKEYVEKRRWLTDEELLDYTSVGRSTPGLMIGNTSIPFGYHSRPHTQRTIKHTIFFRRSSSWSSSMTAACIS